MNRNVPRLILVLLVALLLLGFWLSRYGKQRIDSGIERPSEATRPARESPSWAIPRSGQSTLVVRVVSLEEQDPQGWKVICLPPGGGQLSSPVLRGVACFSLEGQSPGKWTICAGRRAKGDSLRWATAQLEIDFADGESVEAEISVQDFATIETRVFAADGMPAQGKSIQLMIRLLPEMEWARSAFREIVGGDCLLAGTSDSDGMIRFSGTTSGLAVFVNEHDVESSDGPRYLFKTDMETAPERTFYRTPRPGRYSLEAREDGPCRLTAQVVDTAGAPMPGILVGLQYEKRFSSAISATQVAAKTNNSGIADFSLQAGARVPRSDLQGLRFWLAAYAADGSAAFASGRIESGKVVNLALGKSTSHADFHGLVRDAHTGSAIADFEVELSCGVVLGSGIRTVKTDENGRFVIRNQEVPPLDWSATSPNPLPYLVRPSARERNVLKRVRLATPEEARNMSEVLSGKNITPDRELVISVPR